ncbi:MAG: hypothetical protein LUG93_15855 [Lachnospiraceae bacterium]|nr:hypothetical protein [Lachnospiraceae bacterium]
MSASEEKCDKGNASGKTGSRRADIPRETGSERLDISGEMGSEISTPQGKGKSMEGISGWLIHMLSEVSPSLLEMGAGIPECDLEKAFAVRLTEACKAGSQMETMAKPEADPKAELKMEPEAELKTESAESVRRSHSNWKLVVAASGLAAACSAAVAGVVVFVCMKRAASYN